MSLKPYVQQIIDFARQNEAWAPAIVFALALGESFGFHLVLTSRLGLVPLVVGVFAMPYFPFQLANFASALMWAAVVLLLGGMGRLSYVGSGSKR
jgi:membrane protein DedA with SNARE-associated domain